MKKYLLKRLAMSILTIWAVITITFFLMHSIPGDPLGHMAKKLPEQIRENYYAKYGLDQPVAIQYIQYIGNLVQGDLGYSFQHEGRTVTSMITRTNIAMPTARLRAFLRSIA